MSFMAPPTTVTGFSGNQFQTVQVGVYHLSHRAALYIRCKLVLKVKCWTCCDLEPASHTGRVQKTGRESADNKHYRQPTAVSRTD